MKKYVEIGLLVKVGSVERRKKSTKEEWDLRLKF